MNWQNTGGYSTHRSSMTGNSLKREIARQTKDKASLCKKHSQFDCQECNPNAYSTETDPMFQEYPPQGSQENED